MFQFFDPRAEYAVHQRRLPHWEQAAATHFVTFRTADSMPVDVVRRWFHERDVWLRRHGINPNAADWRWQVELLPDQARREFILVLSEKWERQLDRCRGECLLRPSALAQIVGDSLRHFHGDRYELGDFVVMPNHVHLLVCLSQQQQLLATCRSWKHFTAVEINKHLGRTGELWQTESFDHLVRDEEWFSYFRNYIAENPKKARLPSGAYLHHVASA